MAEQTARMTTSEFRSEDEIDEIFSRANPNPTRAGCPPHEVLVAVAGKKLPIGNPAYEHLAKCSPCYQEFRRIQQSAQSPRRFALPRAIWLAAVAAVILIAVGAVWMFRPSERATPPSTSVAVAKLPAVPQPLQIDLRKYSISRTDQRTPVLEPVRLMRSAMNLTILLPVGSEPGRYDVELLDSALRSQASATGHAEIKDFVTTLQATMDLQSVHPGAYQLAVRHQGDDWRLFPAFLK